jgi:hypothetical protein
VLTPWPESTSETRKNTFGKCALFDTHAHSLHLQVQTNGLHGLDGSVPDMLLYQDRLRTLCSRVDRLEMFVSRVKQDLDVVESHMDAAEADVGSSNGTFKNILKPLFFVSLIDDSYKCT